MGDENKNKTKLQEDIVLLENLILKVKKRNNDSQNEEIEDILSKKIALLERLKEELKFFEENKIENIRNTKNLIESLNFLFQVLNSNEKDIDYDYIRNIIEFLIGLERIIKFEKNENKDKTHIKIKSGLLGYLAHFFSNSNNSDLINKVQKNFLELENQLKDRGIFINERQSNLIKIKLKLYFKNHNELDIISLADGILEDKDFLEDENIEILKVLEKHRQNSYRYSKENREKTFNDNEAKPQILFEIDDYVLLNLITENHLEQESVLSDHCVGNSDFYKKRLINGEIEIFSFRKKKTKEEEETEKNLNKNQKIEKEKKRFCCTIEYRVKTKTINQIKGRNNSQISFNDNFSNILIEMIISLTSKKDLTDKIREINIIKDINKLIGDTNFLSKKGIKKKSQLLEIKPEDVIYGNFKDLDFLKYEKYISNSKGIFDLTHLSQKEKNSLRRVEGSIIDYKELIKYENLESVGRDFDLRSAISFSLDKLESVGGDFDLRSAISFSLDKLESVGGDFDLRSAISFSLDKLESVGGRFNLWDATSVSLDKLKSVGGDFDLRSATSVSLDKLESVGGWFDWDNATSVSLDKLKSVGGWFNLDNATSVSLDKLESVGGWFNLQRATSVSLDKLESVGGDFDLRRATSVSLDKLESVGGRFNLWDATSVSLDKLKSVGGDFDLRSATSVSLDKLKSVGRDFNLQRATSFSLDNIKIIKGYIFATTEIKEQIQLKLEKQKILK